MESFLFIYISSRFKKIKVFIYLEAEILLHSTKLGVLAQVDWLRPE